MINGLLEWTKDIVHQYGLVGLFGIAFAESSFFPVPPDALLVVLVLPPFAQSPFLVGLVCTAGSVLGAVAAWILGKWAGRPILERLFEREKIAQVESLYERYGIACILVAAFTPIPYKVFTIASGVFRFNLLAMVGASVVGRGARFFSVGYLAATLGEWALKRMDQALWLLLGLIGIACLLYAFWHRRRRSRALLPVSK
ncbi:MAG: DedA family protein [Armatimonadetes bacterium]|nr:DedA family protein [Armatimonadota bacterium]MDW8120903.1 YqaA family protein [Armatimonadota bacterium]